MLLAAAGCARRPSGEPVSRPALPAPAAAPELLVLDLASRAERDLLPLVEEGGGEGPYRVHREGPGWVLRARRSVPEAGGTRPAEIRAVDSGLLSRWGLLELGELDGADLGERDLESVERTAGSGPRVLRFSDYERLVLRLGPGLTTGAAERLAASVDRAALAALVFERSGRPAGACLPGEPDRLGEARTDADLPGSLLLLVEEGRPGLWAAAGRIAADWGEAGVATTLLTLPRSALRDRLGRGRFEAALLTFTRDDPAATPAAAALAAAGWACAPSPGAEAGDGAGLERWFRESCRIYPLLSLDRVVGLRPGLAGPSFDRVGRIDWSLARTEEEP
jgi:hypothetical protein